jgi:quercetin dioxygenase-like cupin family protein
MGFWNNVSLLNLQDFRPGIRSVAECGDNLVMACMEIVQGREDTGHRHPFEQCGIVVTGKIEMFIGDERRVLKEMEPYFIPTGTVHGWKTIDTPVRLLDVSAKAGIQTGQS